MCIIVTKTNSSESESGFEFEYDYTLDKNGYVETMTQIRYDASETFFSTYTFEWTPVSTPSYTNWLFSDIGSPYYRYLHE